MKYLLLPLIVVAATTNVMAQECTRKPREVIYDGNPVRIYVDKSKADVQFSSERMIGSIHADRTKDLVVTKSPIKNKYGFSVTVDDFSSFVRVEVSSGKTYLLQLLSRPTCPDSLVTIVAQEPVIEKQSAARSSGRGLTKKSLMYYLINGDKPPRYRRKTFEHVSPENLEVFHQGSVSFYLQEQLIGSRFVGTTYRAVNKGRTPFRVGIENINYGDKQVKDSIGVVREVSMLPASLRLGPAPEYVSDLYAATNEGLLFIVSERSK